MAKPKLRLRPWKPGDQDAFVPRGDFAQDRQHVNWDWTQGPPGPTWAIVRWDETVVGVAGFVVHEGPVQVESLDAWAWLADLPRRDWPQLLWLANNTITHMARTTGARMVYASARKALVGAARCLERLGFRDDHDPIVDALVAYRYFAKVLV